MKKFGELIEKLIIVSLCWLAFVTTSPASAAAQYMPCIDISASLIITSALRPAAAAVSVVQHAPRKSQTFTFSFQNFLAVTLLLLVLRLDPSLSTSKSARFLLFSSFFFRWTACETHQTPEKTHKGQSVTASCSLAFRMLFNAPVMCCMVLMTSLDSAL